MDNPTVGEAKLITKYWGRDDFVSSDEFWTDVLNWMKDVNILLPLEHSHQNVRAVREMLDCKPGICGECCGYGILPITQGDIYRITTKTEYTTDSLQGMVWTEKDGSMHIKCHPQCPFVKDNSCTIYEARPDACYFYPVQIGGHLTTTEEGKKIVQMRYRIKCKESIKVVKRILIGVLKEGNKMLLPNLLIIPKEVN